MALPAKLGWVCRLGGVSLKWIVVLGGEGKVAWCLPTSVDKALLFPLEGSAAESHSKPGGR